MAALTQCRGFAAIFAEVAFSLSQVFSGITLTKFSGIVVLYFSKSQIFQVSFCSSLESFFSFFGEEGVGVVGNRSASVLSRLALGKTVHSQRSS